MARLRAIFKVPKHMEAATFGENVEAPGHLAYIEWFTQPKEKDNNNGMYPITYSCTGPSREREYAIVELDSVVRPCQLFPNFGEMADRSWTSDNVLDICSQFYISNWKDQLTFQTIY